MTRWFLLLLPFMVPVANAEMWKCVEPDGNIRYTNVKAEAKGCKGLNLDPPNIAPAPPRAAPAQAGQPAQHKPANFPSVDNDTQRQRDAGRRKILEQEYAQELQHLETAKKQLAEQKEVRLGNEKNFARVEEQIKPYDDKVKQHELNLESLKKELATSR